MWLAPTTIRYILSSSRKILKMSTNSNCSECTHIFKQFQVDKPDNGYIFKTVPADIHVQAGLHVPDVQLSEDAAVHSKCPHLLSNRGRVNSLWLVLVLLKGELVLCCLTIDRVVKVHTRHISVQVMSVNHKRNLQHNVQKLSLSLFIITDSTTSPK